MIREAIVAVVLFKDATVVIFFNAGGRVDNVDWRLKFTKEWTLLKSGMICSLLSPDNPSFNLTLLVFEQRHYNRLFIFLT